MIFVGYFLLLWIAGCGNGVGSHNSGATTTAPSRMDATGAAHLEMMQTLSQQKTKAMQEYPFAFISFLVLLVLILPGGAYVPPLRVSSSPHFAKPAPTKTGYATGTDAAILGWDGDGDAAIAHSNGSFDIRDGRNITVGFGIYHSPTPVQWYNDKGYLPALVVQFGLDHCTVKINSFGDLVTLSGHAYVIVYSRVSIYNHDSVFHREDPAPSPQLLALNTTLNLVQPGQTINHDYAIAINRFGGMYVWPSHAALENAGSWSAHYTHMQAYWNQKLAGIVNISHLPDMRLVNAYKAGYIYTNIVKDGNNLNVGENGYGQLFDHDLIAIQVDLYELGDFANAHAYLKTLFWNNYRDAEYTYSWPWAIYLLKTGDTPFVNAYFAKIKESAHSIQTDRTGPEGTIGKTSDIDANGYWTVDDQAALLGLLAYSYVAQQLGYKHEAVWANDAYTSLLASVNTQLANLVNQYHLNYIPCALNQPNTANLCQYATNANWASMFLFGRWAWDGLLFNGAQWGPSLDMIDQTYDYGFTRLAGKLPAHTYGGYTGYSTAYNAGYGAAGLRGNKYRSESIYDYEFMISNTQSGPFSWWENVLNVGPDTWVPGNHGLNGTGSCPHMWGQANATKALLESLVAEEINAQLLIGRGVPDSWMKAGQHIDISNLPIHQNKRIDLHISSTGNAITLTLAGATPNNNLLFNLPIFVNNISSTTNGTIDNSAGLVTLPPTTRSVTVTLDHPA